MTTEVDESIKAGLTQTAAEVHDALAARLSECDGLPPKLLEAMRYSLLAGGKRLRPALVLWCCEACGGDRETARPPALAIECVHTFSLIHDDLPALDDDDLRRGRPANHIIFGEATAILAGDGLLALAFEILAEDVADPGMSTDMVRELAGAAGGAGMIGGECLDLEGQSQPPDTARVGRIHAAKTARLIQSACRLGAIAAKADNIKREALSDFGWHLGLAFQAADDLLDVAGSIEEVGKATGKDACAGKQTYPRAVGMEQTRALVHELTARSVEALAPFGSAGLLLATLARVLAARRS